MLTGLATAISNTVLRNKFSVQSNPVWPPQSDANGFLRRFPRIRVIQGENRFNLASSVDESWHHRQGKTGDEGLESGTVGFKNTSRLPCHRQADFEPVS